MDTSSNSEANKGQADTPKEAQPHEGRSSMNLRPSLAFSNGDGIPSFSSTGYTDGSSFSFNFNPPPSSSSNPFTATSNLCADSLSDKSGQFVPKHLGYSLGDLKPCPSYSKSTFSSIAPYLKWSKSRIWPSVTSTAQPSSNMSYSDNKTSTEVQDQMDVTYTTLAAHASNGTGTALSRFDQGQDFTPLRDDVSVGEKESSQGSYRTNSSLGQEQSSATKAIPTSMRFKGIPATSSYPVVIDLTEQQDSTLSEPTFFTVEPNSDVAIKCEVNDQMITNDDVDDMMNFIPGHNRLGQDNESPDYLRECRTTPLFSHGVETRLRERLTFSEKGVGFFNQFGLLGLKEKIDADTSAPGSHLKNGGSCKDDLVFANMDAPWSAFICGSQGAGKSHTLSCLLENALLKTKRLGKLPEPLSGIVFHYDKFSSTSTTQICEAAYLCSSGVPVTVLVSPSNIWAMKRMYRDMPGMPADAPVPNVLPLYLTEGQLDISRILKLMAFDSGDGQAPLYMEVVMNILREMAMAGPSSGGFSYSAFRRRLQETQWVGGQKNPLSMRLALLDSFMAPSSTTVSTRPAAADTDIWDFPQGSLTIIDLSDPFVDENDACALFSICLSLFLENRATCGRVIALDEAHKFLTGTGEAKVLTDALTSVMREQRHTGSRVFIATQEPTLSPTLIDLANVTIVHRFLSPAWYEMLHHHLAGAKKQDGQSKDSLFDTIVALETGQALVFCPTALISSPELPSVVVSPLGNGYAKLRVRSRITADGGRSIMANDKSLGSKGTSVANVPMFVVTKAPDPIFKRPMNKRKDVLPPVKASSKTTSGQDPAQTTTDVSQLAPDTSHTASNGNQQTNSISLDRLREGVRKTTRDCLHGVHWTERKTVSWKLLWDIVEDDLGINNGYILGSANQMVCKAVAQREVDLYRRERGLKVMSLSQHFQSW